MANGIDELELERRTVFLVLIGAPKNCRSLAVRVYFATKEFQKYHV